MSASPPDDVVEMLRERAARSPDQGFTFIVDGREEERHLSFAALDRRAQEVAARLQARGLTGERALLLFPAGLELLSAFFGCLYAGVQAIVAPLPAKSRVARIVPRIRGIARDAAPAIVLTERAGVTTARALVGEAGFEPRDWLLVDEDDPGPPPQWHASRPGPEALAYLQYTSGSTSAPRGTQLTHANLLANSRATQQAQSSGPDSVSVVWVPAYHDDGLVQGILQPIFTGYKCVLMAPEHVVARPSSWLAAISRHRATHSGGPNFIYELCLRKVEDDALAQLDLSSWRFAYNAAEPIRWQTLALFHQRFKAQGFRWTAFAPCFGLAEATLMVTSKNDRRGPTLLTVDGPALAAGRVRLAAREATNVRALVGCGAPMGGARLVFVRPGTAQRCAPDEVGELCLAGPSVAHGYLGRPSETAETFGLEIAGEAGTFLRTGDLGFVHDGELFITGRHKDLIIIRGENRYPQDLEWTVETCHAAIRPGGVAAFAVGGDAGERLVIVAEAQLEPGAPQVAEVIAAIRRAVAQSHELAVSAVALLVPGSMPKTSSGKLQRAACRQGFLESALTELGRWHELASGDAAPPETARAPDSPSARISADAVAAWLRSYLSRHLTLAGAELRADDSFASHGLDSVTGVAMAAALGDWLGVRLPPVIAWDYPSIAALSQHLGVDAPYERGARVAAPRAGDLDDPIAIVGIGCRFPGAADSPAQLWQLLRAGVGAVTPAPAGRFPGRTGASFHGGYLRAIEDFEPEFFDMSPREARAMDPQQRLLLEVSWEALADAGIPAATLRGTGAGVFVGICSDDYRRLLERTDEADLHQVTGTAHSVAAGRLSYQLGLTGPSLAVDTACSSSLVAVHLACRSLRAGECELAFAGGVNVLLAGETTQVFADAGMLSPDGRCRSFDVGANGYVRGEGCGVVVLERLSRARARGHFVHAVIRGSWVNQDGRSSSLTAPRGPAQEAAIRGALHEAGVAPDEVGYIEAHGTGTALGDPIELGALAHVFGRRSTPVWIGSIKSTIGHLEGAAGIAGLVKAVLCAQHGEIPAQQHFDAPTRHFDWDSASLRVPTAWTAWPSERRIAGVSSFGLGGTNAHMIVERAPPVPAPSSRPPAYHLLTLSARSDAALDELTRRHALLLARERGALSGHDALAALCRQANLGRGALERRLAVVGASVDELCAQLTRHAGVESTPAGPARPGVVFMFSGQGSQHPEMGRQLYEHEPVVRALLDRCDALLRPELDASILEVMFAAPGSSQLAQTRFTQPALFALEYALCALWRAWGVAPDVVVGHSVGEFAAACMAGVFSLEDALRLVAARGRLMQALPGAGGMLAVAADEAQLGPLLAGFAGTLVVAAVNGPRQVVLSGVRAAIDAAAAALASQGIEARVLAVSHAFHSPLVEPMLAEFAAVARSVAFAAPRVPFVSTVTGVQTTHELACADYWVRQVREPVRFVDALAACSALAGAFLEVGPGTHLTAMTRQWSAQRGADAPLVVPSLSRKPERQQLLESLGELFVRGFEPDWAAVHGPPTAAARVELPTYPFQRRRLWVDAAPVQAASRARGPRVTRSPLHDAVLVETTLASPEGPGETALESLILAAVTPGLGWTAARVDALQVERPLAPGERALTAQIVFTRGAEPGRMQVHVLTFSPDLPDEPAIVHALAEVARTDLRAYYTTEWREAAVLGRAARSLPGLDTLAAAVADRAAAPEQAALERYAVADGRLAALCGALIVAAFARGDLRLAPGDHLTLDEVASRLRVLDTHRRLLQRMLEILGEDGVLARRDRDAWDVVRAPAACDLRRELAALRAELADAAPAEITLIERSGERLLDVLRGEQDPLQLLFPGGDTSTATLLYTASPVARAMNRAIHSTIDALTAHATGGHASRIVEIGAGTGGTTRSLLPLLAQRRVEYTFTDIGPSFLHRARESFAEHGFVHYQQLDIEVAPAAQGFGAHQFDVVIAANVLHATRDPALALAHARSLLAPGGVLVLWEATRPTRWLDLTFGMTSGWWRALDGAQSYPLMAPERWSALLADAGFCAVTRVAGQRPDDTSGHVVMVAQADAGARPSERWLVLADRGGVAGRVAQALRRRGHAVLELAADCDDAALAERLAEAPVRALVHCASLDIPDAPALAPDALRGAAERGCGGVLRLVRACQRARMSAVERGLVPSSPALWLVTAGACAGPEGDEDTRAGLGQAPLWGMARVIRQEHPELACRTVDIDPRDRHGSADLLVDIMLAGRGDTAEPEYALRDGRAWVPRLVDEAAQTDGGVAPPIHADATYLITGGLGSIGLASAQWLVGKGARHLALLGRSAPSSGAEQTIAGLRAEGVEVTVVRADVAEREPLRAALAPLSPPLRGVIHAAGVLHERLLVNHDWSSFARALAPKVEGAWNLHQATLGCELDFFILYSSGCALLGGVGSSNYAAANYFLGALAGHRRAGGLPALCIDWGAWEDFGMARALGQRRHRQWELVGIQTMKPEEALAALERVLGGRATQIGVMPMRWSQIPAQPFLAEIHAAARASTARDRAPAATVPDPEPVLAELRRLAAAVLGLAPAAVDVERDLTAHGLDSLMAVELRNRIATRWQTTLGFERLFDGMSLRDIAGRLEAAIDSTRAAIDPPALAPPPSDERRLPVSHAQQGIWLAWQLDPESPTYNVTLVARLREPVCVPELRRAAQALLARHPVLRSVYTSVAGVPHAQVLAGALAFEFIDGCAWSAEQVDAWIHQTGDRPIDLERGPIVRMALLRRTGADGLPAHLLHWTIHHIATDFATQTVLMDELEQLYAAAVAGRPLALPGAPPDYREFVRWEDEAFQRRRPALEAYWHAALRGATLDVQVPTRPQHPPQRGRGTDELEFRVDAELAAQMRQLARREQVTVFTVLLTVWAVVLARLSGQRDLVIDAPASMRTAPGFERLVGCSVNPVLIRIELADDATTSLLLAQVHRRIREALEHGAYPYTQALRQLSRDAALRVGFVLDQSPSSLTSGALLGELLSFGQRGMDEHLYLSIFDVNGAVSGRFSYDPTWFEREAIERMAGYVQAALSDLCNAPPERVGLPRVFTDTQRRALLTRWNPESSDAEPVCVHQLVEQQAARTPDAIAVASAGRTLSYAQLVARARQLAAHLRERGVGPDIPVAICMARTVDVVVGILGVLMAGGAYVPIDPALPAARRRYILADALAGVAPRIALVDHGSAPELPDGVLALALDLEGAPPIEPHAVRLHPANLAYVIYTSGSTGEPKGVGALHGALATIVRWGARTLGPRAVAGTLASTSLGFDISVFELFVPLVCGGTCVVVGGALELVGGAPHPVTFINTVPSVMRELLAQIALPPTVELVALAGEPVPEEVVTAIFASGERRVERVLNAYGPSETTIYSVVATLRADQRGPPPIGDPIEGTQAYVLDPELEPVPVGVTGDLYLAGTGLARGYLGRPGHTAESFLPNPFGPGRLYRTGDRARHRSDGQLEYLGRRDHQVKIRGVRIELGEIEAALRRHPAVVQAAAIARVGDGQPGDVLAYVVAPGADPVELRESLGELLPAPVVPSAVILVDTMPLTANGKLDRQALARHGQAHKLSAHAVFVAPRTELEGQIAALWRSVLQLERVGVHDRFTELGGHSLLATRIVSRIHETMAVELPLREFFAHPTVGGLAEALEARLLFGQMRARVPESGPMEVGEL